MVRLWQSEDRADRPKSSSPSDPGLQREVEAALWAEIAHGASRLQAPCGRCRQARRPFTTLEARDCLV